MQSAADDGIPHSLTIDRAAATPLHRQVADALRRHILAPDYCAGAMLPSEVELALTLGVSRQTVRQGLAQLANEGLLQRVVGRGTFVAGPRKSRTGVVACIVTRLSDDLIANIVDGAEQVGRTAGLRLQVANALGDPDLERRSIDAAADGVDGMIIFLSGHPRAVETIARLERSGSPFVLVDRTISGVTADLVTADNVTGGRLVGEHLLSLGHRRMLVVRRAGDNISTVKEREHGFRGALAAAGIAPQDAPAIFAPGHLISAWDYLRLPSLADHPDVTSIALSLERFRPTAAFAINDITGLLTILAANRLGWPIPERLAVVGFGDDSHSLTVDPPLTTVHQDPLHMGRRAMQLLIDRLERPAGEPRVVRLPVHLVVRASSSLPA
ncbi:MAG TPA: GntR family transcriptional regulator [Chloroflexota bacterium]|nr:GntR family transcriptional regulator [Chloroflexota bacterium]